MRRQYKNNQAKNEMKKTDPVKSNNSRIKRKLEEKKFASDRISKLNLNFDQNFEDLMKLQNYLINKMNNKEIINYEDIKNFKELNKLYPKKFEEVLKKEDEERKKEENDTKRWEEYEKLHVDYHSKSEIREKLLNLLIKLIINLNIQIKKNLFLIIMGLICLNIIE